LHDLDKRRVRELIKIAVLLVKEGQVEQEDILRNNKRTRMFSEFLNGMAWPVDLVTHTGFVGGLSVRDGGLTMYWANPTTEVVFHDICMMPTDENDPQQIKKKKHVGNDICTIVWSEHKKDYDPSTVTTHFNFVHLVIYPLEDGLFRISVYSKEGAKLPFFGPICDGMILNKRLLPTLVRQTMINSNRVVRERQKQYKRPIETRDSLIKEINDRYQQQLPFHSFFSDLFSLEIAPILETNSPRIGKSPTTLTSPSMMDLSN